MRLNDRHRQVWLALAVGLLLAVHLTLAVRSLVLENPTIDELIHLPAGISYWQRGTFRLYHHNPPLVKLIAAVPVLVSGVETNLLYPPSLWRVEPLNQAVLAHLFAAENAQDYFELFTRARLLMPLFSILGGLVVYAWSSRLYGAGGGLLSLALWVFCPNVLVHCRLVTTDIGATALRALATFLFWRYLKDPSWRRAVWAGLALGLAELTKFSLILLYGLWPLLAVKWSTFWGPLYAETNRQVAAALFPRFARTGPTLVFPLLPPRGSFFRQIMAQW